MDGDTEPLRRARPRRLACVSRAGGRALCGTHARTRQRGEHGGRACVVVRVHRACGLGGVTYV